MRGKILMKKKKVLESNFVSSADRRWVDGKA